MNPEENPRQCAACGEQEPSFQYTVSKNSVFRRLCTDCLLKEHRDLFCPVCLVVFVAVPPPEASIICQNCSSITHVDCSPPPSSSAASSSSSSSSSSAFTCPPCSDPNFSFFPKSLVPSADQNEKNDEDGAETVLDIVSSKALVAAAEIAVVSMKNAAAHLKNEALKKSIEAKEAKKKAKEALGNLHDLYQEESENKTPQKRKNDDR